MFKTRYCIRELGEHGLLLKPEPVYDKYNIMIFSGGVSFDTKEELLEAAKEFNFTHFTIVEIYIKE